LPLRDTDLAGLEEIVHDGLHRLVELLVPSSFLECVTTFT